MCCAGGTAGCHHGHKGGGIREGQSSGTASFWPPLSGVTVGCPITWRMCRRGICWSVFSGRDLMVIFLEVPLLTKNCWTGGEGRPACMVSAWATPVWLWGQPPHSRGQQTASPGAGDSPFPRPQRPCWPRVQGSRRRAGLGAPVDPGGSSFPP